LGFWPIRRGVRGPLEVRELPGSWDVRGVGAVTCFAAAGLGTYPLADAQRAATERYNALGLFPRLGHAPTMLRSPLPRRILSTTRRAAVRGMTRVIASR
jgi:hypothetical protein